jgi:hypothetical protein
MNAGLETHLGAGNAERLACDGRVSSRAVTASCQGSVRSGIVEELKFKLQLASGAQVEA